MKPKMSELLNATEAATLAVQFERINQVDKAIDCYRTAARFLDKHLDVHYDIVTPDLLIQYKSKVKEYLNRATVLEGQSVSQMHLHQCQFLHQLAQEAEGAFRKDDALKLYTQAVDLALHTKASDSKTKAALTAIAREAIEKAEKLKGISNEQPSSSVMKKPVPVTQSRTPLQREMSVQLKLSTGQHSYTPEEKSVLLHTSKINNNCFVPFMDVDLNEKFQYIMPFEDSDGKLKLAAKQMREFSKWVRPDDLCSEPKMIAGDKVDCFSVKQTIITDCSFIASLTVSALCEKKFKKRLITKIIYPRNSRDEPVYNPFGKYMIKLHINGIRRKVIIDDFLPYSKYGQLLCSYSSNKNEFWVSLLEKAYMKVMGGYDFPGSNSNTDLHALTGWIPERCPIKREEQDFNSDYLFELLRSHLERGNILATAATGPLALDQEERTGLAATHAYAVLDVRDVNGIKLLKLKNPWSHTQWKGNYSDNSPLWTAELRRILNYNQGSGSHFENEDNGVFWIDYNSILNFFDVFYLNWNPQLFKMTYCIHQKWDANTGPLKDSYTVGENPQFSLHVKGAGEVWLLLTRHITRIEDFRDNQEYITLLVYKTNGRRVYYPYDPPPYIDGVRINSPHYLCKIKPGDSSTDRYTLVVSQYEKTTTIFYTLRAYGTCEFTLNKLEPYPVVKHVTGEWNEQTAGGCENHPQTYPKNPKFMMTVPVARQPLTVTLEVKGPRLYQMGISVTVDSLEDPNVTAPFLKKSSGNYRSGFVVLEVPNLPAGKYIVTVATFLPGQFGNFFLDFRANANIGVSKIGV